jgi:translation initiation factor IF-3
VPIPRKFDRRPPERDETRINEMIRVPQVRLIGDDGNQIGVVSRDEALQYAQQRDLDLVEVAADARPPVCRVLDYSKYKYEQEQKQKAARRHQKQIHVREIKLRPKIATNDYETKKGHVKRFLDADNKVKVTIMFRGREMAHPERGEALLMRLAEDVADLGVIEQRPNQDGRNMTMMLGPVKKKEQPEHAADQPQDGADQPQDTADQPQEAGDQPAAQAPEQPPAQAPEQPAAKPEEQAETPAPAPAAAQA